MVKTMIYWILLHLRSNVGVNSKGQSLGNLYQGLCLLVHIYWFTFRDLVTESTFRDQVMESTFRDLVMESKPMQFHEELHRYDPQLIKRISQIFDINSPTSGLEPAIDRLLE